MKKPLTKNRKNILLAIEFATSIIGIIGIGHILLGRKVGIIFLIIGLLVYVLAFEVTEEDEIVPIDLVLYEDIKIPQHIFFAGIALYILWDLNNRCNKILRNKDSYHDTSKQD